MCERKRVGSLRFFMPGLAFRERSGILRAMPEVFGVSMYNPYPFDPDNAPLEARRVPCMVAFLHPFRIVNGPDGPPWTPTIEQINGCSWDYIALHEIVGGVDVGLAQPYHLVVGRDGGLALPPLPQLRNDAEAVEFFNRCFAALLLGGQFCEAISLDGLDFGSILDWKYIRIHSNAASAPNRFHQMVRMRQSAKIEAISLMEPRTVSLTELIEAMKTGRDILDAVPELSGEFLLKGVTGIARRDWSSALANLWIVVEQITSHLWKTKIILPAKADGLIPGRVDQLSDSRTWTTAIRLELLSQKGFISMNALGNLFAARKARNALAHEGALPDEVAANSAYKGAISLLQAVTHLPIPLAEMNLGDHALSDPFKPIERGPLNVKYWMEILRLPGELELERLETKARKEQNFQERKSETP